MAFGVLPPFNPLLVTKAFFNALVGSDFAYVSFRSVPSVPSLYAFAQTAIGTDSKEPLFDEDFTILGSAADNQLTVPKEVASAYLHAIRVFQGVIYSYEWPFTRQNTHRLLEDDEHTVLTLLFGLMYDLPGTQQCLARMGLSEKNLPKNIDWEPLVLGELHPTIEKISYKLGEIIRNDCLTEKTEAASPERFLKILSLYETVFIAADRAAAMN